MTNNVINLADHCKKRAEQLERERKALRDAAIAFAMRGDQEKIQAAGCDAYIAKPIRYKEFLKVVAQSLSV